MMYRGRIEMDDDLHKEPVTISIDTLDHWPRELGSLDPDKIQAKFSAIVDREVALLFKSVFPIVDLDEWKDASGRRLPAGINHGVVINGS